MQSLGGGHLAAVAGTGRAAVIRRRSLAFAGEDGVDDLRLLGELTGESRADYHVWHAGEVEGLPQLT